MKRQKPQPEPSSEQQLTVDEPQEVYSAATLAGLIREALLQSGNLRVDLQGAERMHTAVLQVLIAAQRTCKASDRTLVISSIALELQPLLQIAGLTVSNLA